MISVLKVGSSYDKRQYQFKRFLFFDAWGQIMTNIEPVKVWYKAYKTKTL
jgi:hypothetical protein